jgi:hypothetical protein
MDYTIGIKHPYRGHHYVLQNVLIMPAVQLTLYKMENFSSFMGDPAPTVYRHMTTVFAGCNTLPEVCKLKLAHHLLSLSVL